MALPSDSRALQLIQYTRDLIVMHAQAPSTEDAKTAQLSLLQCREWAPPNC